MSAGNRSAGPGKRALVALAMGALVTPFTLTGIASADVRPIGVNACPEDQVTGPDVAFDDVEGLSPEAQLAINCIADYGVTQGVDEDSFEPGNAVNRAQMALFLARMLSLSPDLEPLEDQGGNFTDIGGLSEDAQDAINILANLEITLGVAPGQYGPSQPITRAQMASFLARTQAVLGVPFEEATEDFFTDDNGSVHEDAINQIAQAGLAQGVAEGQFGPLRPTTREQMAKFLARHLDVLVEEGIIEVPQEYQDSPTEPTATLTTEGDIMAGGAIAGLFADLPEGATVTVTGAGFQDEPVTVDAEGAFELTLPADLAAGEQTLVFTITLEDGTDVTAELTFEVVAPASNQTFTVTGGETLDAPGTVTYTVTGITSETVDIALVATASVTDTAGVISFTGGVGAGGAGTNAVITSVNGVSVGADADDYLSDVLVLGGTVQFTVMSETAVSVTPVVFNDADDDDTLDVDEAGLPTEAFGVGGATNFIAIADIALTPETVTTAFGSQATVTAQLVDVGGAGVAVAGRNVRFEVVRGGTVDANGAITGGTVIAIGGVETDANGTATFTVTGPADPNADTDDLNVTDLVRAWYDVDEDAVLDAGELSDVSSVTFSDDAPDAVGAVVVDNGTAGVLDEADTVVLSFGETVLAESSITVTDADGDMTVLSDEMATDTLGDGITPVTVTGSGTTMLRFELAGPVDVTTGAGAGADGVLDLPLAITAATGITNEATGTAFDPATDPEAGNVPAGQDPAAPAAAVVTTPAAAMTTNALTFDIVGTAEAGATVSVRNATGEVGTGTADASGAFTVTVPLLAGENAFTVVVTDAEGFASAPATVPTITQDTTAPGAATVTSPAALTTTNAVAFDIVGTTEAGASVSVSRGTEVVGTAEADVNGAFTVNVLLVAGENAFTVVATDVAGNASAPTTVPTITQDTTAPAVATDVSPAAATTTNDPAFAVTGTAEAGATVRILRASNRVELGTGPADATTGAFSVDPTLDEGANDVVIVVRDIAGNESTDTVVPTITQDTVAPMAIDASGVVNVANTANLFGDEVGDTVEVRYDGAVVLDANTATANIDSNADGTVDGVIDCANTNVDCAFDAATNTVTFAVVTAALATADQISVTIGSAADGTGSTVVTTTGITDAAGNAAAGYPERTDAGD
ncbi:MAG: S-layer homology domain-containing protein [Actinomycetota bacterium]|nr:S-layer homology domain-containing protein [Actinomycetota bacterium]